MNDRAAELKKEIVRISNEAIELLDNGYLAESVALAEKIQPMLLEYSDLTGDLRHSFMALKGKAICEEYHRRKNG